MTKPQQYEISTVMDIVALEPGQRERCVHDLLRWAAIHDLAAAIGAEGPQSMAWIDDGKHDATIHILPKDDATEG